MGARTARDEEKSVGWGWGIWKGGGGAAGTGVKRVNKTRAKQISMESALKIDPPLAVCVYVFVCVCVSLK